MRERISGLLAVLVAAALLGGCAAPQQAIHEPTPEELAAIQDSIAKANEFELKKNRMFAYERLRQKDYLKAREYFWNVVKLDVKHQYNDWARIYQTYLETGQVDSAQVILREGLKFYPDDPFLNGSLGFYLKAQGEYDEALQHYLTALKSEPDNPEYIKKVAEIYETLSDGDNAIEMYQRLLELTPEDRDAKDRLTTLLREFRDPEEYIRSLEQDVEASPDDISKRVELIIAYAEQSMNEKIPPQADEILARDPGNREAYSRKAAALENLNRLEAAIATYKAELEQYPDDIPAMLRIADDYRLLGKYTTARKWVVKAKKAGSDGTGQATYVLGLIYESSGDDCSSGRGLNYDDKLVFVIAYGLFKQAAAGSDFSIAEKAQRKVEYLQQFIPLYSDWFMHQNQKMPGESCYKWIQGGWPEVKYINRYLGKLEKSK